MTKKYEPINRVGGPLEMLIEEPPRIPALRHVRVWLLENWPHDHAWFVSRHQGKILAGMHMWTLEVYVRSPANGQPVRWCLIDDFTQLHLIEGVVIELRAHFDLPPVRRRLGEK